MSIVPLNVTKLYGNVKFQVNSREDHHGIFQVVWEYAQLDIMEIDCLLIWMKITETKAVTEFDLILPRAL